MWFPRRLTRTRRAHRIPARRQLTVELLEDRCLPTSGLSAALVADIVPGGGSSNPVALVPGNGTLFFIADDGAHGPEVWKCDGAADGTVLVKDINPGSAGSLNPVNSRLFNLGGTLYFSADDGVHGEELWTSDGTADGTVLVKDINPGSAGSYPNRLTMVNGVVYFSCNDGVHDFELWRSDGTETGTFLVKDINPGSGRPRLDFLTNLDG